MLDDLKLIHERDAQDTLGIAERQWKQLGYEFEVSQEPIEADNVVYAGMGGSSLAAVLSDSWPGYNVPFQVVRDYDIPEYVSDKTYFIAASYSGNTEETLSALEQAEAKGAKIAVIAGGGKLVDIAKEKNYPLAILPKAEQPRYAVFYNLKALLTLLDQAGLLANKDTIKELESTADFLQEAVKPWVATIPTDNNRAKQIALEVIGKTPVIYAGPKLWPAAYKWKISFNENAKHVAWANQYPEFNHNEFMGWTKQPVDKPYTVIDLRSSFEHPRIQKRFEVSERLLSGMRPAPIVVDVQGKTLLEQLLWTIAFGDFVTIYTALLNGLNPAPVDLIEKFKKALDEQ
jgi:glucose/mannose-6-phosphate isomerase